MELELAGAETRIGRPFSPDVTVTVNPILSLTTMSLLQDVLRSHTADSKLIERKLSSLAFTSGTNGTNGADKDDDDYELVGVVRLSLTYPYVYSFPPGLTARKSCANKATVPN